MCWEVKILQLLEKQVNDQDFKKDNNISEHRMQLVKASGAEAFRLYDLNLLAFVLNKFDFWGPKCPNYENIEF